MFKRLSIPLRRRAPRGTAGIVDRRSGAPYRRRPDPMPRMRWYS